MAKKLIQFTDWPVKWKICFIVLLTAGSLIAVMVFAITFEKSYSFRAKMKRDSIVLAEIIGANSTAAIAFNDQVTATEIISALKAEKDIIGAALYGPQQRLFANYYHASYHQNEDAVEFTDILDDNRLQEQLSLNSPWFDTMRPILLNDKTLGHIIIRTDLSSLTNQLQLFLGITAFCSLLLLSLAMFVSYRLIQAVLKPVSALADTMKNVTITQEYDVRVSKQHDDEIGVLIEGFNDMLENIKIRDGELAEYRNHLEDLVSKRTEELQTANKQLKHEIEERQEVQKKLAHAQKMEAIGTLAGGVAHDLNNILSGIVSYPDLLLMQLPADSSLRTPIETIKTSGKKAAAIVQDLLTLARRGVKVEEQIELKALISQYLSSPEYKELVKNRSGVVVNFDSNKKKFFMKGSPVHLSKTVMNLVSNAVEAIYETGQIDISLEQCTLDTQPVGFSQWRKGPYIRLTVADTGIGISEKHLERIFEPFYSRKIMDKSGTGLGMSVVWGTMEDHKGHISVLSEEGKGTTFTLLFPAEEPSIKEQTPSVVEPSEFKGSGESILLVDDSEQQRQIASDILTHLGYTPITAPSGEEAIRYLKDNTIDLVILDMIMDPGINGLETFKKIIEFRPSQKAIIASGYSRQKPIEEARTLGISDFVVKPYSVSRIGQAVYTVLKKG